MSGTYSTTDGIVLNDKFNISSFVEELTKEDLIAPVKYDFIFNNICAKFVHDLKKIYASIGINI